MLRIAIAGAALAMLVGGHAAASDALVPTEFAVSDQFSPETLAMWPEYKEQLAEKDPMQNVFTAKATTPEGDELVITQMNSPFACGDAECPVKVIRNGKTEFDGGACRYTEQFFLNKAMNTLFMCDDAVPTVTLVEK